MQLDSKKSISLSYIQIYAAGFGIDGLASIIKFNFQLDPYEKDILFHFYGRRSDLIKRLAGEGDGFLLLYKSSRGDFPSPLTPPYMPFGIRRFNITSKHDAHCNNQDSL